MNLTVRLLLLVVLALLPALGFAAYKEYASRERREAEVRARASRLGDRVAIEMRQIIEGLHRLAATLAQIPHIREAAAEKAPPDACADILIRLRREYPGGVEVGVVNAAGRIMCASHGGPSRFLTTTDHYRRAMAAGSFVVGGYGESQSKGRYLTFGYPLRNEAGQVAGAAMLGLDLDWLAKHMGQRFSDGDVVVGLADRDLTYVMRLPDDSTHLVGKPAGPAGRALAPLAGKGPFEATGPDGVRRVGVIVPLSISPDSRDQPDLLAVVGISRSAAFQLIDAATREGIALILLTLLLALLAAVVGGRYFVHRPVERLIAAAARWREGDYKARVAGELRGAEFVRLGMAFDTMAEKVEERDAALRASEERFRSLASLVPAFIWFADREGSLQYMNERWYQYTGRPPDDTLRTGWIGAVHPDDMGSTLAAWKASCALGEPFAVEARLQRHDGVYRWFLTRAEPLRDQNGVTGWFGSSTDIDDIRRAELHRDLLINELNHRVKNTLTTVQSIAAQSLRSSNGDSAKEVFEARLLALSKTHDVLTRESWDSAELREVIAEAIEPYHRMETDRFVISGPEIRLLPSMALALAMAVHELCTNAAKYGALSVSTGHVTISWHTEQSGEIRRLKLVWRESDGPPVAEPRRKGFGSRLIQRSVAVELNGDVDLRYEATGLVCTIDVPLVANGPAGARSTSAEDRALVQSEDASASREEVRNE